MRVIVKKEKVEQEKTVELELVGYGSIVKLVGHTPDYCSLLGRPVEGAGYVKVSRD